MSVCINDDTAFPFNSRVALFITLERWPGTYRVDLLPRLNDLIVRGGEHRHILLRVRMFTAQQDTVHNAGPHQATENFFVLHFLLVMQMSSLSVLNRHANKKI